MILVFFLIYFIATEPLYLLANDILTPELFRQDNKILDDCIITEIQTIYHHPDKKVYLTFDDGPSKTVTNKILDILDKTGVKANFFVIRKPRRAISRCSKSRI